MQKKRVGLISHDFYPYQGGLGRHATELLRHINAADMPFSLIGISPLVNEMPEHKTYLKFTHSLPADQLQFSFFMQFYLQRIIKQEALDAVILNGGPGGVLCLKKLPVPLIYIANHTYAQQASLVPGQRWKKVFIPVERKGYALADAIIAISKTTANSLHTDYSLPEEKISVIPPGFDFSGSGNVPAGTVAGRDVLFVGRLDARKGVRFLIESFLTLSPQVPDCCLQLVGSGADRQELEAEFSGSVAEGKITFHGFLSDADVMGLRSRCAVQVIPSRLEGFGLAAVEAIRAGTPVIATQVPGLTDIIVHEQTGLLVPFGATEKLAAALHTALTRTQYMQELATTALSFARNLCSWNTVLPAYVHVLNPVLETATQPK